MVVKAPLAPVVERSTSNPVSLGELSCQARLIAPGETVAERLDGPFWLAAELVSNAASASGASGRSGSQAASGTVKQTRATSRASAECMDRLLTRCDEHPPGLRAA